MPEKTTDVYVDEPSRALANQYAAGDLKTGWNHVTLKESFAIAAKIDKAITGGLPYKRLENRLKSLRNQFLWAWGPEATILYQIQQEKANVPDEGRGIPRPSPSDCSAGGDA